ncbi:hypothetical protein ILYODFUR_021589 [Ilyodon furcidens]|uniref:Uncharacterized protein n=1 Tax=Ilyodon furcidens TaxID=33524 RepID=A0ABV0V4Z5_9TELE
MAFSVYSAVSLSDIKRIILTHTPFPWLWWLAVQLKLGFSSKGVGALGFFVVCLPFLGLCSSVFLHGICWSHFSMRFTALRFPMTMGTTAAFTCQGHCSSPLSP